MKYPCENCIKYPMCLNKEIIVCSDLIEYALGHVNTNPFWKTVNKIYPNCYNIYDEKYKGEMSRKRS
jgi:hypothetical protein